MLLSSILSNPVVAAALVAAIPSSALAIFGYRRSKRVDAVAEQSGMASMSAKGVDQVIEGLNKLVERLQEDNAVLRDNVRALDDKLSRVIQQCEELRSEIRALKAQLNP